MNTKEESNETSKTSNIPEGKEGNQSQQPLNIVDEARAIRDEIRKEKESLISEREKLEKLQSENILSGGVGERVEPKEVKEETDHEYRLRIERELRVGKYNA